MKLYIDAPLIYKKIFTEVEVPLQMSALQYQSDILKQLAVYHTSKWNGNEWELRITEQKVMLSESDMSELFAEVIECYFSCRLVFTQVGGSDFGLRIEGYDVVG